MEMFTLKRSKNAWVACCRACGHEQALAIPLEQQVLQNGFNVSCERCPSEEVHVSIPAPAETAVTGTDFA